MRERSNFESCPYCEFVHTTHNSTAGIYSKESSSVDPKLYKLSQIFYRLHNKTTRLQRKRNKYQFTFILWCEITIKNCVT